MLLKAKRQHLERVAVVEMLAAVVAGGRALHEKSVSLLLWEEYGFVVLWFSFHGRLLGLR